MRASEVMIIGGGLAGCEAAWQAARRGVRAVIHEMRPLLATGAHRTDLLAELVCSNSFKSDLPWTAPHLLKAELRLLGSLAMRVAEEVRVPAGHALAVDRTAFAARVTEEIERNPMIDLVRGEVRELPQGSICVVATGPLTSDRLCTSIVQFTGADRLYFYDAISPIVDASTIDRSKVFPASRYGKGGDDYLNAPMTAGEYSAFYEALVGAETVPLHAFESTIFFEGCLPIEELARRGRDTLRFGPMKPVGLRDPRTGRKPFAAVQLRLENAMADSYNLVGFQNHLRFPEQERVFRLIPGLENAEFLRFGQIHRNTYIQSPSVLEPTFQARRDPRMLFAGQICGVEGYAESMATGLLAGLNATRIALGRNPVVPPRGTACGSLAHYITRADPQRFQPANISFGLLPEPSEDLRGRVPDRQERRRIQVQDALCLMELWIGSLDQQPESFDLAVTGENSAADSDG